MEKTKESERWLCTTGRSSTVSVLCFSIKWYKASLTRGLTARKGFKLVISMNFNFDRMTVP